MLEGKGLEVLSVTFGPVPVTAGATSGSNAVPLTTTVSIPPAAVLLRLSAVPLAATSWAAAGDANNKAPETASARQAVLL